MVKGVLLNINIRKNGKKSAADCSTDEPTYCQRVPEIIPYRSRQEKQILDPEQDLDGFAGRILNQGKFRERLCPFAMMNAQNLATYIDRVTKNLFFFAGK